jgi:hypothetical protein
MSSPPPQAIATEATSTEKHEMTLIMGLRAHDIPWGFWLKHFRRTRFLFQRQIEFGLACHRGERGGPRLIDADVGISRLPLRGERATIGRR